MRFVSFISERGCLVIQRKDGEGRIECGINIFPEEMSEFINHVKKNSTPLRVSKYIEENKGMLPEIKINKVSNGNIHLTQQGTRDFIVMRVPEGIQLLEEKLKKEMKSE